MKKTRHTPEQIIRMLRQAEAKLATGSTVLQVAKELGISEATFHRWKTRYGGMRTHKGPNVSGNWRERWPQRICWRRSPSPVCPRTP
jgi:putative transposase